MAYGYYAAITIDNTEVGGTANITDWPVLVKGTFNGTGTEPDLRVTGSGGHIENVDETATADGASDAPADFACYDDDSMTTEYDFEIASYDKTTGAIEFWVRIPTLDYDNDTIFYIHYGDSGVTTSQETITTVWTTKGFVSVYHGENVYDSCGNNNLTSTGVTYATAKVGKGFIFDSDTDGLAKASPSGLTSVTRLGILAWTQIAD